MTRSDELGQALSAWFAEETVAPAPAGLLARVTEGTAGHRPRPRWQAVAHTARAQGLGLGLHAPVTGNRIGRQTILILGLLLLLVAAATAIIGSRLLLPSDPVIGVFESVQPMPIDARRAVVLPDGMVVVAGPDATLGGGRTFLAAFDPATGSFTPLGERAGSMDSVTALADGRILIVGIPQGPTGRADGSTMTGALFDPTSGQTIELGPTVLARSGHVAVALHDGRVLLVGGEPDGGATATAELFDPTSGTFIATGSMARPRGLGMTATVLDDGRVLIAGGASDGPADLAELYDPATGTFTATGAMSVTRSHHTATLLNDGRVLFAGGISNTDPSGADILVATGDVFDPPTGTFAPTEAMQVPRIGHIAAPLRDGRVLIAGGLAALPSSARTRSAEIFDPETGAFQPAGSLTVPRGNTGAAVLPDGDVLVFGDADFAGVQNDPNVNSRSAEVFR